MNAASLIANLTSRGVVLAQTSGDIQVRARKGEITGTDIQVIQDHKPELLELLAVPSRWDEYYDAIARAFANPSTREEIGPLWMTEPGGFGPVRISRADHPL